MGWIDLHSHILPGFDDGASDDVEFLQMARIAVAGGTATMVATPHYDPESPAFGPESVKAAVENYQRILEDNAIPLKLLPGLELKINAGLLELAGTGGLAEYTLARNGGHLLVELPMLDVPLCTMETVFRIRLAGVIPVLAHPERNRQLQDNPALIEEMSGRGVEMQVNAGSLEGLFGRKARRLARRLVKEGKTRLVASDAHGPGGRNPDLSRAASTIGRLLGPEAPDLLLEVNPALVLEGGRFRPD